MSVSERSRYQNFTIVSQVLLGTAKGSGYNLRNSEGQDEELLNKLYDAIIENYQHNNHYLIVLFFDR